MKFFVDTADINEINELSQLVVIDGVTTNPSLIYKSGRDFKEVIKEAVKRHNMASKKMQKNISRLDVGGEYSFRLKGEKHVY